MDILKYKTVINSINTAQKVCNLKMNIIKLMSTPMEQAMIYFRTKSNQTGNQKNNQLLLLWIL